LTSVDENQTESKVKQGKAGLDLQTRLWWECNKKYFESGMNLVMVMTPWNYKEFGQITAK